MGKETKIGLGIIAVLAAVFAVLLVQRVIGSREPEVASDKKPASTDSQPLGKKDHDSGFSKKPAPPKITKFAEPTTVVAKPATSRPKGPGAAGSWSVSSKSNTSGTASAPPLPPSFMPDPQLSPSSPATVAISAPPPPSADPFQAPARHAHSGPRAGAYTASQTSQSYGYESGYRGGASSTSNPMLAEPNPLRDRGYHGSNPRRGRTYDPDPTAYPSQARSTRALPGMYESAPVAPKTARQYDLNDPTTSHDQSATVQPDGTYVVQPNDSFWRISKHLYGTGAYFKALAEFNRAKYRPEDSLRVGDTISAPEVSVLEEKYPDLCPSPERRQVIRDRASVARSVSTRLASGREYTVEEGDTLYDIARYKLGKGSRWPEIYELNRDVLQSDFDYLTPGIRLILPETADDVGTVTRRPDVLNPR